MVRLAARLTISVLFVLSSLLTTFISAARASTSSAIVTVSPALARSGDVLRLRASGFEPGEPIDARVATPAGGQFFLAGADPTVSPPGDPVVTVTARAAQQELSAGVAGEVSWVLSTAVNYQVGNWSIELQGRRSGQAATTTFSLSAPTSIQPLALEGTPATPVSPPTSTPTPLLATPARTPGAGSTPTTVPVATDSATTSTPVPATAPAATVKSTATPSATPVATAQPPSPTDTPTPEPSPLATDTPATDVATPVPDVPTSIPVATAAPTPMAPAGPVAPVPPTGPALAPAQLLPTFARASALTGVPQEVLLAIAHVESGFDPRAVGPYLPQFAGTENEYALGMMQFLPATYRGYVDAVDAATGKQLGMSGIWDAESAIYAAAYYLRDNGAPGDMRRALFAYNNANWYVDLVLSWAAHYAGGVIPDQNGIDYGAPPPGPPTPSGSSVPLVPVVTGAHIDAPASIKLYAPWTAGETWHAGGDGSFYGDGLHDDQRGIYYAIDFNKGAWPGSEQDDGAPVLAAADGTVSNIYQDAAGAWIVELQHTSPTGVKLRTRYVHLKGDPRVQPGISIGQTVTHGTPIGQVGSTGTSTGPHLHFEFAVFRDGAWVSARPEPMEGQSLVNGSSITSANAAAPGQSRYAGHQFGPPSPSNADMVTISASSNTASTPVTSINVEVNASPDGTAAGAWLPVGVIPGDRGSVEWLTAPVADGVYAIRFTYNAADGSTSTYDGGADRPIQYTIRRGPFAASAVARPRADMTQFVPLRGDLLSLTGGAPLLVSGPLRFGPLDPSSATTTPNIATAGTGLLIEGAATNLVVNPSFETDTSGWNTRGDSQRPMLVTLLDGGVAGNRSVRLDNRASATDAVFFVNAGSEAALAWSVFARAADGSTGRVQLAMSGLAPSAFDLTATWQRVSMLGSSGGAGTERQVIVPAGSAIDLDAAQLEVGPAVSTYLDGSMGPGYAWTGAVNASPSTRAATVARLPRGPIGVHDGAISVTATPLGGLTEGARLLQVGDAVTITVEGGDAIVRVGADVVGRAPWVPGERHRYDVSWSGTSVRVAVDGIETGSATVAGLAMPADAVTTIGADQAGDRVVDALVADVEVWARPLTAADAMEARTKAPGVRVAAATADPASSGEGATLALSVQGRGDTQVQFSVDGTNWTPAEPVQREKRLPAPFMSNARVFIRFITSDGRQFPVIVDPQPPQLPAAPRFDSRVHR